MNSTIPQTQPKISITVDTQELSDVLSALTSISARWSAGPSRRALRLYVRLLREAGLLEALAQEKAA